MKNLLCIQNVLPYLGCHNTTYSVFTTLEKWPQHLRFEMDFPVFFPLLIPQPPPPSTKMREGFTLNVLNLNIVVSIKCYNTFYCLPPGANRASCPPSSSLSTNLLNAETKGSLWSSFRACSQEYALVSVLCLHFERC